MHTITKAAAGKADCERFSGEVLAQTLDVMSLSQILASQKVKLPFLRWISVGELLHAKV